MANVDRASCSKLKIGQLFAICNVRSTSDEGFEINCRLHLTIKKQESKQESHECFLIL